MALTITTQPGAKESAYNSNKYVITSDDTTVEKVKAEILIDSVSYVFYAQKINSEFTFELSSFFKSTRPDDVLIDGFITYTKSYDITFTEVITSGAYTSLSGKIISFNIEDFIGTSVHERFTTDEIITPGTALWPSLVDFDSKIVRKGETIFLGWYAPSLTSGYVGYTAYKTDGSTTTGSLSSISDSTDKLYVEHIYSEDTDYSNFFENNVYKVVFVIYTYDGYSWLQAGESKTILIEHQGCDKSFDEVELWWVNDYNVLDSHLFNQITEITSNREAIGYYNNDFNAQSSSILKGRGFIQSQNTITKQYNIVSYDENNETLQWLYNIWKSRAVYLNRKITDSAGNIVHILQPVDVVNEYSNNLTQRNISIVINLEPEQYD